jgi:hypothetical protein
MVRSLARVTALLAVLAVSPALAEEKAAAEKVQVGLGVSVGAFDITSVMMANRLPTNQVYVPISFGQFRVEPSLGYFSYDQDLGGSGSALFLGVGGFYVTRPAKDINLYGGARLGFNFVSDKSAAGVNGSATDFRFALTAGGEWLASPRFSLGAEAQLGRTGFGELKRGGVVDQPSIVSYNTLGLLFFRFYL